MAIPEKHTPTAMAAARRLKRKWRWLADMLPFSIFPMNGSIEKVLILMKNLCFVLYLGRHSRLNPTNGQYEEINA
jgi:hypothetical protein